MRLRKEATRPASQIAPIHLLLAAAVLGLLVLPIAFAGAAGGPEATTSASVKKTVKKLNKKVKALQAEQGQPRPPSGAAGGGLTGTYPNPSIASNVIGAAQIKSTTFVQGTGVAVAPGASQEATVTCPAGTRLVSGGPEWESDLEGTSIIYSVPSPSAALTNATWVVKGRVAAAASANKIFAEAACLAA